MSTFSNVTPATPTNHNNDLVNELLLQLNGNDSPSGTTRASSLVTINSEQISAPLQCFKQQQELIAQMTADMPTHATNSLPNTSSSVYTSPHIKLPEYYNNAKYEEIICKPIKPLYDGSSDQLVPFLNRLDIRRQDEGWHPITFLNIQGTKYDLTPHFAKIDESVMLQEARHRWPSPTVSTDKHTVDHPTYNARVLAHLLMGSATDEFCITVINRVPQDLRNDGPLLLWIICNNIHRNNIAFIETIKRKIRESTIAEFGEDVGKYIISIKNNLRLITSSDHASGEHNDLIIYIFQQLKLSNITLFREAIEKWNIKYLEAKMPDLTPTKLLKMSDDKMQILKHAGQWKESEHPGAMALKLELQQQKHDSEKIVQHLVPHVSRLSQHGGFSPYHNNKNQTKMPLTGAKHPIVNNPKNYPPWMIVPPSNSSETKLVDRRIYMWCTKCRQGSGLWICRHTTDTHVDGYTNNRNQRRRLEMHTSNQPATNVPFHQGTVPSIPQQQYNAQLSLLDYLDDYLPTTESNINTDPEDKDP